MADPLNPASSDPMSESWSPPPPAAYDASTAPPGPPAAPPGQYQDRINALLDKQSGMIDRAAASMDKEATLAEQKSSALAPLRQKTMDIASQQLPSVPSPETPPPVPKQQVDRKTSEEWLFNASLLGALAGGFTRRHVTNAAAAFQGYIEGAAQGNKQAVEQSLKIWEAENKRVQEKNAAALTKYREIMENRKQSLEQMAVELQMAAAQFDDKAMAQAARSKNSINIAQLYDQQVKALSNMQTAETKLQQHIADQEQKYRIEAMKAAARNLGMGTDPGQMQALVDAIGQGRAAPVRGRAGMPIMSEVTRQYPDYDEGKYKNNMFRSTMAAHTEMAANNAAERTAATQGANIEMISRTIRSVIPQAIESSHQVDRSEFRQLNQLVQLYEKNAISDPKLARFAFDTIQVAEGWARSMNPRGQMRIEDRRIALDHISTVDGPEAYEAVLKGIEESLWREAFAAREQREHKPLAPPAFGTTGTGLSAPVVSAEAETRDALNALAGGADPAKVMERYRQRGGDPATLFNPAGM